MGQQHVTRVRYTQSNTINKVKMTISVNGHVFVLRGNFS